MSALDQDQFDAKPDLNAPAGSFDVCSCDASAL